MGWDYRPSNRASVRNLDMADTGGYSTQDPPMDTFKAVDDPGIVQVDIVSDFWKVQDTIAVSEAPITSSITTDTGGGGVTVDGGRANPLCPRANP